MSKKRDAKKGAAKPASSEASGHSMAAYEALLNQSEQGTYVLRLFITGMTPRSQQAIEDIRKFCDAHLAGRYELEIVDIYQQPVLAKGEQIIATPTLIKKLPLPLRKLIGDLSDPGRVLLALGVKVEKT